MYRLTGPFAESGVFIPVLKKKRGKEKKREKAHVPQDSFEYFHFNGLPALSLFNLGCSATESNRSGFNCAEVSLTDTRIV